MASSGQGQGQGQSKQTYSICYCFKRRFRVKEAQVPADIKLNVFQKYSSENGSMGVEHLHRFLKEVQGEANLSLEEAERIMESFLHDHKHLNIFHRKTLYINEFLRYLLADSNSPLPYPPEVHQDMSAPLSHYFIYTGHNSYLTGNQISSACSEDPIIKALQRGVRVIELDMWPNSTKDDVDIMHGGTLTAPVKLIKCLRAIKEHAFLSSDFPVILTLEDHLTSHLQAKVAEMVTQVFGDTLVSDASDCVENFPSPESLKRRVIISTKHPKEYLETKSSIKEDGESVKSHKSSSELETAESAWGRELSDLGVQVKEEELELADEVDEESQISEPNANAPPEYKRLIGIRAQKMKGGIKPWLKVCPQNNAHRVSLNEEKLQKAVVTHGTDIVRFNQQNLMRVYPKGMRIDSSNYNPLVGWMHGAQMVAFNMQGHGRFLWLMQGFFRANGGCGYVKKPDFLMHHDQVFDPKRKLPVKTTLKVKVYMGEGWNLDFHRTHFDLYSPPDFYVKIGIAGVGSDWGQSMKRTRAIEDNWNPEWDEEFEFPISVPELALLRIEVHEFDMSDRDDFGGQTCLPVWELRSGIRAVPLHDQRGDRYKSVRLLMRFNFV
ncbi:phosphoinositide phospholipase C 2-like [Andrographis paniculata]|uniref:phosphoinositide phospholipase C 2-like n=1 Tax=Andrographis paniculata TaxID=175694 RepID=UPI0021E91482|nr:phosphoinositide phospholipase C 2-like [Andrographis paniculata]